MNQCSFLGRLTKDPELIETKSDISVVKFTLAVRRSYPNDDGEYEADFPRFTAFDKRAEVIAKYFSKGRVMGVQANFRTDSYEDDNGETVYTQEFIVNEFYFGGDGKRAEDDDGEGTSSRSNRRRSRNGRRSRRSGKKSKVTAGSKSKPNGRSRRRSADDDLAIDDFEDLDDVL